MSSALRAPLALARSITRARLVKTKAFDAFANAFDRLVSRAEDEMRGEKAYLEWDDEDERIVFRARSDASGEVSVHAFGPFRSLRFNGVEQGLSYANVGRDGRARAESAALPYEYLRTMTAAYVGLTTWRKKDLMRDEVRVFYVGLGAGAAPAFARRKFPRLDARVAEIDPLVADVVREHHGVDVDVVREFSDDAEGAGKGLKVVLQDCARTIETCEVKSLDVIFMDAFDGDGEIPAHLFEDEFLKNCGDALVDGGSLVLNMFNGVRGSKARKSVARFAQKLERIIGPVCSFPVMEQPVNVVLSATKVKLGEANRPSREELVSATAMVGAKAGFEFSLERLVEGAFWVDFTKGGEFTEVVAGKPGVLGKFKGRNGTIMPREFLSKLEGENE